jgi:hypothetical protein
MNVMKSYAMLCLMAVVFCAGTLQAQKKGSYACSEANAETLCSAENTCGAGGSCTVDIKKDVSITVTPNIPHAKKNHLFCVKAGTQVTFDSTSKNTGFVVDFGPNSPFDKQDSFIGGNKKPDSATAKNPGCYRYSVGACVSGGVNGMCATQPAELVVTK